MPKFHCTIRDGETYVRYTCPGCNHEHSVPADRWRWNGDIERPSLSPSVRHFYEKEGKEITTCHYHIKLGKISFCRDSQHDLAGQTVDLPDCYGAE